MPDPFSSSILLIIDCIGLAAAPPVLGDGEPGEDGAMFVLPKGLFVVEPLLLLFFFDILLLKTGIVAT